MVNGMTSKLYVGALYQIIFGFIFIAFDIRIQTTHFLPDWIGYYLFYKAIDGIGEYEESAKLLRPLIIILGVYNGIIWILMIMNVSVKSLDVLQLFMNIISIYIQFQLLTNISNIALSHHFENESKRLNILRIMNVISVTFVSFPAHWVFMQYVQIIITLFYIVIVVLLILTLIAYAKKEKT